MPRWTRWLGIAGVAALGVLAPTHVPKALAHVNAFRVADVNVSGLVWADRAEILAWGGIGSATNVWEPLDELATRIETHPLVISAEVRRNLPRGLAVEVRERTPVGLVPTPTLEAVDREGRYLPIDPAGTPMDLPILVPRRDPTAEDPRPGATRLKNLARLADAMREDPVFWSRISEIREMEDGTVVARWGSPDVEFQLRSEADLRRLREGLAALEDAMSRREDEVPGAVDLRWADQVVIRYGS